MRLHSSWGVLEDTDGSILVWSMKTRENFRIRPAPGLVQFVELLLAGVPVDWGIEELARRSGLRADIADRVLQTLLGRDALIESYGGEDANPPALASQVRFLEAFDRKGREGAIVQRTIQEAHVAILGLGGLGSWVLMQFAMCGIGRITGVDHDIVEISNLGRQLLYTAEDALAGRAKVDAAAARLSLMTSGTEFRGVQRRIGTEEDLAPLLQDVDLLLLGFGNGQQHKTRDTAARCASNLGVPFLTYGVSSVGPLCIPGETACFNCLFQAPELKKAKARTDGAGLLRWMPTLRYVPWMTTSAAFACDEAIRYLSGFTELRLLNSYWEIDHLTGNVIPSPPPSRIGCEICGRET